MSATPPQVIFGTGAVGLATMEALRRRGERVRMVNRSGTAPVADDVEVLGGDAGDPAFASAAADGAQVVYQTLNPPYHRWVELFPGLQASVLAAAEAAGARLVSMENVYLYGRPAGQPLTETHPYEAHTKKGRLRARMARELLAAHQAGRVQVAIGRASDYFGPRGGAQSMLGDRVFPAALAGKTASVLGDPDQPHTYTYIPDIGEGLAVLGEHPDAPGRGVAPPQRPRDPDHPPAGRDHLPPRRPAQGQGPWHLKPAAASHRSLQPHRAGAGRAAVRVRGALHRGQQQDHRQVRPARHPGGAGPGRHAGQLSRQTRLSSAV
jgi:uncharacterized protein YbjT (DUF2867 family)